ERRQEELAPPHAGRHVPELSSGPDARSAPTCERPAPARPPALMACLPPERVRSRTVWSASREEPTWIATVPRSRHTPRVARRLDRMNFSPAPLALLPPASQ